MNNQEAATVFIAAIKKIASEPEALNNFELYLSHHFSEWLKKFANTPENIAAELKHFAEIEV